MQNNNLLSEISALVLALALIASGTVLLVIGKITYVETVPFLISILSIFGINVAVKAPSPAQQSQLNTQQQQLSELTLHNTNMMQSLMSQAHTHAESVQATSVFGVGPASTYPQTTNAPAPQQFINYGRHFPGDSQVIPVVTPQQP
jgi:hypothetical protein